MQEIALILSSLAGVATAAAVRKAPRNKMQLLSLGASSHIKNQINSLKIEKDILTKTISRLYQIDPNISKINRDKLLLKYQHQLGVVLARLEKLEEASQHPDLGPIGDGLITLMDQKLSKLDDRLFELSSKIAFVNSPISETVQKEPQENISEKRQEYKAEEKSNKKIFNFETTKEPKVDQIVTPIKQSIELTTLTRLPNKESKLSWLENKNELKKEIIKESTISKEESLKDTIKPKIESKIEAILVDSKQEIKFDTKPNIEKEFAKITEFKALPEPKRQISTDIEEDFDEDSSDDLDKIKGEIMKVLSKIEQAEVE